MKDVSDSGAVFDALGDATRRRVVAELSALGTASPTELAHRLPITRQAVSKHLVALADAGLVSSQRSGRAIVYRLTPEPFTDAVSWMTQVGAQWDDRLGALREHLGRRRRRRV
ncbi:MAG: metalloregulator ArsR/SmtB family transcription factor [Actinomycetota bacterium]